MSSEPSKPTKSTLASPPPAEATATHFDDDAAVDHDTEDHEHYHHGEGEVTGLTIDTWFPFSFLVFAVLVTCVVLVAWSIEQLRSHGNYLAIPVLLVALVGVLLSPVIGHYLNLALWELFGGQGLFILGAAGVVLAAVVGWLWVEVEVLKRVVGELRAELAVVKIRV